ncbi:MAG: TVP38/TMEM64 family protein [Lachnospirales bacterium]
MSENKKSKGSLKLILLIIIVVAFFLIAKITGFLDFLTNVESMQSYFQGLGFVGFGIYILIYIIVAIFMLPASVTTIVAGIVFGPIYGAVLALIGSTIGATCAFIISRYIARGFIYEKFKGNSFFEKIEKGVAENGTSFLILTRLVPIFPYNVQNYAYGVTNMNIATFTTVSFICMAPGAFIYAYMAGEIVTNGVSFNLLIKFALAGVILFLVSLIPKYIAKRKGISLDK